MIVEEVGTGTKRKPGGNRLGSDGGHPLADTIIVQDLSREQDKTVNNDLEKPPTAKYSFKLCFCKNKAILAYKLKKS